MAELAGVKDLEEEVPGFQATSEQAITALDSPCRFTEISLMILNGKRCKILR